MDKHKRIKIDRRRIFSLEEKEVALAKSKGLCSHCGVKITIGENFTVEHVIPLSEGGTNHPDNLVALCEDCNKAKSSSVYNIDGYYKHLTKSARKSVKAYFNKYMEQFEVVSATNAIATEELAFNEPIGVLYPGRKSNRGLVSKPSKLKKAAYCDLDEIYEMLKTYTQAFKSARDVKTYMSYFFESGSIYYKRNVNGEIGYVFFCQFVYTSKWVGSARSHPVRLPVYYLKIFINPKLLNIQSSSHQILSNSISAAMSALMEEVSKNVQDCCEALAVPFLVLHDNFFLSKLDSINRALAEEARRNGSKGLFPAYERAHYTLVPSSKSNGNAIMKSYWDTYCDSQLGTPGRGKLSDPSYTAFLARNWDGCDKMYADLQTTSVSSYLRQYCTDVSLEEVIKLSIHADDVNALNSFFELNEFVVSSAYFTEREVIQLNIEDIDVSMVKSKPGVVPSFVKVAMKQGDIKPLSIGSGNKLVDTPEEYTLYLLYKEKRMKTVPCRIKVYRSNIQ